MAKKSFGVRHVEKSKYEELDNSSAMDTVVILDINGRLEVWGVNNTLKQMADIVKHLQCLDRDTRIVGVYKRISKKTGK